MKVAHKLFNKDEKATGFLKVERMEDIFDQVQGKIDHPHRHEYYTVLWVRDGEGSHRVDFNDYPFATEQVHFVSPGQVHQVVTLTRPTGWVLTFHPDFLLAADIEYDFLLDINLFKPYSENPPVILNDPGRLNRLMEVMSWYYEETLPYHDKALGAALKLFLIECIGQCTLDNSIHDSGGKNQLLVNFRKLVETHFREKHKVGEYADLLFITPKHLNEVIKNSTGITAKEYIIDRILLEAKRLLLHSDNTVKQIARELGFAEPLNFNAFFKKRLEKTPLQFRREGTVAVGV
ncbi:MAG TPA: transcriptional regulator [Cytophagales bacterium]|nr:transcriptional regulator [Cytophagales bacterium]HAA19201.1 transcriptional regulator [Cytophagales bacterium]HAP64048.1 transcriptional regulator [Cytophagales bacterium]